VKKNAAKKTPPKVKTALKTGDNRLATLAEIADEHSVEKRTFNLWVKNAGCPRESRGLYDRKRVNAWKEELRQADILAARAGDEGEKNARGRLIRAQADLKEFELAQKRGEFIKVRDAVFVMANAAVKANNEFDQIPKSSAIEIVNMDTVEAIENHLTERVNEAKIRINDLADAAETIAKRYSADLVADEVDDAPRNPDDRSVGSKKPHDGFKRGRAKR
jgi:phage terminase Nu1 subunit (DNA packaging protein)